VSFDHARDERLGNVASFFTVLCLFEFLYLISIEEGLRGLLLFPLLLLLLLLLLVPMSALQQWVTCGLVSGTLRLSKHMRSGDSGE
jgi:hypothetical protein